MRRVVAGEALECRLPFAVKTLWCVIASPYHIAGLIRWVGAALCIVIIFVFVFVLFSEIQIRNILVERILRRQLPVPYLMCALDLKLYSVHRDFHSRVLVAACRIFCVLESNATRDVM